MTSYKIHINDRNYTSWEVFNANNFNTIDIDINPIENKLFSNDVFTVDNDNRVCLSHSSIRSGPPIPAVLILANNKTYGRQQKVGKTKKSTIPGKLLYKCVPDDIRIPEFLVPYEIKKLGFSKVIQNLYVTISFNEWTDKHPRAKLDNVIGTVDVIENYYEYQLYCKTLNVPIQKFQKDAFKAIGNTSHDDLISMIKSKHPNIQDRTDQKCWHIITIDPPKSTDFDDGFSVVKLENNIQQLSIYISNVTIWMDSLNLWESFSRRISTIYLPDKKRPMLPTILSDCLCSLQENTTRIAFVMDLFIQKDKIIDIKFSNCFINVFKNYCYEERALIADPTYPVLLNLTQKLSIDNPYVADVRTSTELVCYLMILMNYNCAMVFIKHETGIFRSTILKAGTTTANDVVPDVVPEEVQKYIKIWNSVSGQYIDGASIGNNTRHNLLNVDAYVHITSPIRRLVDLLNIIKFQQLYAITELSDKSEAFYDKWVGEIAFINSSMRSIRKIQTDSTLLNLCYTNKTAMEKHYDGYLFDKMKRSDGLYQFVVYIPELKMSSRITLSNDFDNYVCKKFKLFLFVNEERFKKKIRLQIV